MNAVEHEVIVAVGDATGIGGEAAQRFSPGGLARNRHADV